MMSFMPPIIAFTTLLLHVGEVPSNCLLGPRHAAAAPPDHMKHTDLLQRPIHGRCIALIRADLRNAIFHDVDRPIRRGLGNLWRNHRRHSGDTGTAHQISSGEFRAHVS
jgi:hypothetical protein